MKIPTNTKKTVGPYKRDVYDAYVTWRSLPVCMRQKMANSVGKELASDDEKFGELLKIRTQSAFAEKYNVENSTLSNWNKLLEETDGLSDLRKWGQKLTKNILWSLYKNTVDKGSPRNVELWLQIVEGWTSKNYTEHSNSKADFGNDYSLAQMMKETINTHKPH